MNMTQIKEKAKKLGIKTGKLKKAELIRAIQIHEGNSPCYQTDQILCNQESCCWRDDCLP